MPSSELYRQVQGRAACPGKSAVQPDAAQAHPGEQQKAQSKWLQTSAAPRFHNFLFVLNALYCTFSAVRSEDSHTNNPYPTQRGIPLLALSLKPRLAFCCSDLLTLIFFNYYSILALARVSGAAYLRPQSKTE